MRHWNVRHIAALFTLTLAFACVPSTAPPVDCPQTIPGQAPEIALLQMSRCTAAAARLSPPKAQAPASPPKGTAPGPAWSRLAPAQR